MEKLEKSVLRNKSIGTKVSEDEFGQLEKLAGGWPGLPPAQSRKWAPSFALWAGGPAFGLISVCTIHAEGAPSLRFCKGGWQTACTMSFSFYATRAANEIFPQPSLTRTSPTSPRK